MKTLRLILLGTLLLSSGCLKFSETLTLHEDGSGVLDIEYSIPEETVTQITGMIKLAEELAMASGEPSPYDSNSYLGLLLNPSETRIEQKMASYTIEGLVLNEVKVESRDGSRRVRMQLTFKSIADLARTDFYVEQGFALTRLADGNYRLSRKGNPAVAASSLDMNDPEVARLLSPVLGGFEATIGIKTPRNILQANTARRSLRQAVWVFDFNHEAAAFRDFYSQELIVDFDGRGLSLPAE
jgi:hypothetical protein